MERETDQDGNDEGQEALRTQFHDLRDQADAALARACVGTPHDALMADAAQKRATGKKTGARARQVAEVVPGSSNDSSSLDLSLRRLRGVITDSGDEDAPPAKAPRTRKPNRKGQAVGTAPVALAAATPVAEAPATPLAEHPVDPAPADPPMKRGPKKKDLGPFSISQLQAWEHADEESVYFDADRGAALLRSITRFETIQQATVTAFPHDAAGREGEELTLKRLQVASMGIKACVPAKVQADDSHACLEKNLTLYQRLVEFCDTEPTLKIIVPKPLQAKYFHAVCNCEFGETATHAPSVMRQLQAYTGANPGVAHHGLVLGVTGCLRISKARPSDVARRIRSGLSSFNFFGWHVRTTT